VCVIINSIPSYIYTYTHINTSILLYLTYYIGAADDLRRVTQIAYQMVQVYGMNERVGQVAFPKEEGQWPQDRY
jgi:ATP-dependent Zn protease